MAGTRTKIFVGHLPDGCRNEDLQLLFEKYGTVTECDVINKYGFVHMSSSEEAEKAIENLNNYNLMGSNISVEPSKSKLHPQPGAPGRAKGGLGGGGGGGGGGKGRGGMGQRNGYGGRDSYGGGPYSNGMRRYDPFGGPMGDSYYDRSYGYGRERMRPYPPPYERAMPSMSMMSPREEYGRRSMGMQSSLSSDPYGHPMSSREEIYERRPMADRASSDYLYSRRSPPSASLSQARPYWYEDMPGGTDFAASRAPLPAASRRPYF